MHTLQGLGNKNRRLALHSFGLNKGLADSLDVVAVHHYSMPAKGFESSSIYVSSVSQCSGLTLTQPGGERERGRVRGRERGREGGREGEREREREMKREREGEREGEREEEREGGREGGR